jgi:hypothetical protein
VGIKFEDTESKAPRRLGGGFHRSEPVGKPGVTASVPRINVVYQEANRYQFSALLGSMLPIHFDGTKCQTECIKHCSLLREVS